MGKVDRAKEAIDTVFYDLSRNERITLEALRELRRHLDELINGVCEGIRLHDGISRGAYIY
jgi:hypothetical protein